ncbi:nitroreductase family protein [Bacillus vallismortis]|uniref:nitroreductase family protein n=2 Tax=Bacillus vallismortis TaxID=72361 RepID=UPI00028A0C6B|nr:nitroreductase family protein [Bacillus vallismortis]MBG9767863.1 NAD(P)H nitroreductase [Bacillus vallismortis]MCI3986619.1 nitroreductase family protein [Bacillus vallismortis]MCI4138667.1 nitroreductase family protein [Bacillus vallismortis]MCY7892685.1 nitroreductase family protein [Bacillus vallismortis]MCY8534881.1 nitroreductase family protein [Bacillus vallismortis]
MTNTLDVLKARASVKEYDTNAPISKEELTELLDLATKAPSAWNLQHWHFTVFHSDEAKAELLPVAYNQKQIVESSAVVAILGDLKANENGEDVYAELVNQGYITDEIKQTLLGQINGAYQSEQFARDSAFLNASLAAMQLMIAAKAKGYDTCAIGGFNKEQFQKQFDISERYVPVMLISIGKAVKPAHQSNRLPLSNVSTWL